MSLNWTQLYDADVILQFRVLIRILEPISVPNQSRDSFILIKLNPLSTGEEFVSFNGKWCFKYLNWRYLYEADVFLQFRVLIPILQPISVHNQSRDSFILIKLNALSTGEEFVSFKGKQCFKYLNWRYLYEADVFLQFRVLIRVLEPISVPNQSRDSFILIKLNTLSTGEEFVSFHGKQSFKYLNWR